AYGIDESIRRSDHGGFAGRSHAGARCGADCLWTAIVLRKIRPHPPFLVVVADPSARLARDPDSFRLTLRTASQRCADHPTGTAPPPHSRHGGAALDIHPR